MAGRKEGLPSLASPATSNDLGGTMTTTPATTTTMMTDLTRRTATAAVAAGVLLFAGVAGELAASVQTEDGRITRPALAAAYTGTWVLGSAALVLALRGLQHLCPPDLSRGRRSGRTGYRLSLTGAGLLLAFGVVHLLTGAISGTPAEASFLLFALGLLLSVVGHALVGLHLRHTSELGRWWAALPVAAAGLLAGVMIPVDPWHDLGLFAFDAAWVGLGAYLLRDAVRRNGPALNQREDARS